MAEESTGPGGKNISGGEKRRLGLARVLFTAQSLILLDEPCSGLDDVSRHRLMQVLLALPDTSMIIFLHEVDPAWKIRSVYLELGQERKSHLSLL